MSHAIVLLALVLANPDGPLVSVPDPGAPLPSEREAEQQLRLNRLSRLRQGAMVIARPAGDSFGPPNSLAAIKAVLAMGADGVYLELERTADGVWVVAPSGLWLDDEVDIPGMLFEELILSRFVDPVTQEPVGGTIASIREALFMIRAHGALVDLAAEPGKDLSEPVRLVEAAGLAAHFLGSRPTPPNLIAPVRDGTDVDLATAREQAAAAKSVENSIGGLLFVEDPRALLTALGRPASGVHRAASKTDPSLPPMAAPNLEEQKGILLGASDERDYRLAAARLANWAPRTLIQLAPQELARQDASRRAPLARALGQIAEHRPELLTDAVRQALIARLADIDTAVQIDAAVALAKAGEKSAALAIARMLESELAKSSDGVGFASPSAASSRARLAYALGRLGKGTPEAIKVLEETVRLCGAGPDGCRAAWGLGRLRAAGSIGVLRQAAMSELGGNRMAPLALATVGTDECLIALETMMNTPSAQSSQIPEKRAENAAWALARFNVPDRAPILAKLLVHGSAPVRRRGVLGCLQDSGSACRTLLELGAPWALAWWKVEHGQGAP